jgi:hypothetical protein
MEELKSFHKELNVLFIIIFIGSFITLGGRIFGFFEFHWAFVLVLLTLLVIGIRGVWYTNRTIALFQKLSRKKKRGIWDELRNI